LDARTAGNTRQTVPLRPIQRRTLQSLATDVYTALREAIVSLALVPSEALSENDLARQLSVSRTPVREALKKLADEGLVEIYPQTGTFVARIDMEAVNEAQFIREAIEVAVIAKTAQVATDDDVKALNHLLEQQSDANARGDLEAFYASDEALHAAFSQICGFKNTWRTARAVKTHLDRVRRLSLPLPQQIDGLIAQHAAVVTAVAEHDPAAAQRALRTHLREVLRLAPVVMERHPEYFAEPGA
jgi:GntR family transcriptional regulator, rspAB operon transcriptional repressor